MKYSRAILLLFLLFSTLSTAQGGAQSFLTHGPAATIHDRGFLLFESMQSCWEWYFVPLSWEPVPGSVSVAVELAHLQASRFQPIGYVSMKFKPESFDESRIQSFARAELDRRKSQELNDFSAGRLPADSLFYQDSARCPGSGFLQVKMLPLQISSEKDTIILSDHSTLSIIRRVPILQGTLLPELVSALEGSSVSWPNFLRGRLSFQTHRELGRAWISASAEAIARFRNQNFPRSCRVQVTTECHPKKFLFWKVGEECTQRREEFDCVAAHTITHLESAWASLSEELHLQVEDPQVFDSATAKARVLSEFMQVGFDSKVETLLDGVTRVTIGETTHAASEHRSVAYRQFGLAEFNLFAELDFHLQLDEHSLSPLRRLYESPFYQCWSRLPRDSESASTRTGTFTSRALCPMYDLFSEEIGL